MFSCSTLISTQTMPRFSWLRSGGGYMKISSQPPLVHCIYMCACISFWLISFYLWLILVFLFSRVYYGFTPLQHRTSHHYTSRQVLCRNPTLAKCGGWSPTLGKVGGWESSGTPECSELDSKGQNTSHWGVLGVIGKVLKRKYRKCPRIGN